MLTQRYLETRRCTLVGAVVNLFLSIIKIVYGYIGFSQALVADGIHSLADLITDAVVILAAKLGSRVPDRDHPYGHGRIETIFALSVALLLLSVGLGLAYNGFHQIFVAEEINKPSTEVIIVAIVASLVKEILYRYTIAVGKRIDSDLLQAHAWNHRSDVYISFLVLIGVIGTRLGISFLDALAAIIIAVLIIKMSVVMGWQNIRELIDTAVDSDTSQKITQEILQLPGVRSIHQLRSRLLAGVIFIDVHVQVDPRLSVSEGHYISEQVAAKLVRSINRVVDVTVHIDPEEDVQHEVLIDLPNRDQIVNDCRQRWQNLPGYQSIIKINLHYLLGKIEIEVILPMEILKELKITANVLQKQYQDAVLDLKDIKQVEVHFRLNKLN